MCVRAMLACGFVISGAAAPCTSLPLQHTPHSSKSPNRGSNTPRIAGHARMHKSRGMGRPSLGTVAHRWRFQVHNVGTGHRTDAPSNCAALRTTKNARPGNRRFWKSRTMESLARGIESKASKRILDEAECILSQLDLHGELHASHQHRRNDGIDCDGASPAHKHQSGESSDSDDETVNSLGSLAAVDAVLSRRQMESEEKEFGRIDKLDELNRLQSNSNSPVMKPTTACDQPVSSGTLLLPVDVHSPSAESPRIRAVSHSSPPVASSRRHPSPVGLDLGPPAVTTVKDASVEPYVMQDREADAPKPFVPPRLVDKGKFQAPRPPPRLVIALPPAGVRPSRARSPIAAGAQTPTARGSGRRNRSDSVSSHTSVTSRQPRPSIAGSLSRLAMPCQQMQSPAAAKREMEMNSIKPTTFLRSEMGMSVRLSCKDKEEYKMVRAAIRAKAGVASARTFNTLDAGGVAVASGGQAPPELRVEWRAMKGSRLELMLPPNPPERIRGGMTAYPRSIAPAKTKDTSVRRPGGVAYQLGSMASRMRPEHMQAGRFLLPSTAFAADAGVNTLRVLEMEEKQREVWLRSAFAHSSKIMDKAAAMRPVRPFVVGKPTNSIASQPPPTRVKSQHRSAPPRRTTTVSRASPQSAAEADTAKGRGGYEREKRQEIIEQAMDVAQTLHSIDPPFLFRSFCRAKGAELTNHVRKTLEERWKDEGKIDKWDLAELRANKASLLNPDVAAAMEPHIPAMLQSLPAVKNKRQPSRHRDRASMRVRCGAVALTLDAAQAHVDAVE